MKKLTVLICLLAASITLGACSSGSQSTQSEEEATQQKLQEEADEESAEAEEAAEEAEEAAEKADEEAEEAEEAADEANQQAMAEMCPANVEGVKAEAKKGEGKMSLAMMASGDNIAEVQKRAKMMAEHHNSMHEHRGKKAKKGKKGMGMGKGKGMMKGHGVMGMSTAEYEKTDKGAMIHFTPAKAEHMEGLEKQVGQHAKWINEGKCPGAEMAKGKKDKKMKGKKGEEEAPADE